MSVRFISAVLFGRVTDNGKGFALGGLQRANLHYIF